MKRSQKKSEDLCEILGISDESPILPNSLVVTLQQHP
ncbi:MAG: hypothetical protein UZ01_01998 [Candidatus Brocadia sinica]|nr:MAG: hypothetical protein UZ01_01998 [Candidatus Brocadia sinica]